MDRQEYLKQYRLEHKEKTKEYNKLYKQENSQKIKEDKKLYYLKNKEQIKKYLDNHKEIRKEQQRNYLKNPCNKLKCYLRHRIYMALKGNPKLETTTKLVGCSIKVLKSHLEKQFTKGMSWSNYGTWHVDHIRPCASFDLSITENQKLCFNYNNLQPLWAEENLHKHASLVS